MILSRLIWQLLSNKMAISKPSGNTVKIETSYSPKAFDIWHFSLQNRSNCHKIQIWGSIFFNLTPRSSNLVRFKAWSFIKRFTTASTKFMSKFMSASFVGCKKLPKNGSKKRRDRYFNQNFFFRIFTLKVDSKRFLTS